MIWRGPNDLEVQTDALPAVDEANYWQECKNLCHDMWPLLVPAAVVGLLILVLSAVLPA